MKRLLLLGGLALTLITAGCIVASVYPFYTEKDLTFDPALVGVWAETQEGTNAPDKTWTFEKAGENAYTLTITSSSETNSFPAHLFKLKDSLFLDLFLLESKENSIPPHYLMRVDQIQPTLKTRWMDFEWMAKLLEKEPNAIRHIVVPDESGNTNNSRLVLTADTRELQKFVLKHLKNEEAYTKPDEMHKLQGK